MFNYKQTLQIKTASESRKLELWSPNKIDFVLGFRIAENINRSITIDELSDIGITYEEEPEIFMYQLTLDNLFPWLDRHFGDVENPEYSSYDMSILKADCLEYYFNDPEMLTDIICEAITNLKK
jgi:hypothetical protein